MLRILRDDQKQYSVVKKKCRYRRKTSTNALKNIMMNLYKSISK